MNFENFRSFFIALKSRAVALGSVRINAQLLRNVIIKTIRDATTSSNALLSPPPNDDEKNEKDSTKLWNDIVSAFREDGFPNLSNVNGAIREELLSLYRRLASSDKEDDDTSTNPSKFVIAWEAFASNNANIKDDVKSIPNAENIESFREYILKDVILVQKDEITRAGVVGSKSKNQKKKKLSKFEKQAQKKARLMTMGEHLEMHDEDVDGKMEVKEVSAAEEEPLLKTPFKETTENNNSMNLPSAFSVEMKTPGSYRKAKKKTSSSELVKTIFEGSSFKSSSSSNARKRDYFENSNFFFFSSFNIIHERPHRR